MVNQKKDRLLNEYLSPLDITRHSLRCSALSAARRVLLRLTEKSVIGRPGGADPYAGSPGCKGWVERLPNPNDKRGVLVNLPPAARQYVNNAIN